MKVANRTKWRTDDLKAIFKAAIDGHGWPEEQRDLLVMVSTRNRRVGGNAYLGKVYSRSLDHMGYLINMHMPSPGRINEWQAMWPDTTLVRRLAQVFVHECDHAFGELRHKEMVSSGDIDVSAAEWLPLRPKEERRRSAASPEGKVRAKLDRCAAMLKEHASRLRREQKLVAKWRRKVRYHEKRLRDMEGLEKAAAKEGA